MFENRLYRTLHKKIDLIPFSITVKETNLHIQADLDLTEVSIKYVLEYRGYIEQYIEQHPIFSSSIKPIKLNNNTPAIIHDMIKAGISVNVGPMASIAGAIAEYTGKKLLEHSKEIIIENGGDIFVKTDSETIFSIFAGNSPLSMKIGIKLLKRNSCFALCTSSGTVGHSKSFGKADAVTIIADSCIFADAAATAFGNLIQNESDIAKTIKIAEQIKDIQGIIIIKNKKIGFWGDFEIIKL